MSDGQSSRGTSQPAPASEIQASDSSSLQQAQDDITSTVAAGSPARIRKKSSIRNVQQPRLLQERLSTATPTETPSPSQSVDTTPSKSVRKSSLRGVVRRIFGRKYKADSVPAETSPPAKTSPLQALKGESADVRLPASPASLVHDQADRLEQDLRQLRAIPEQAPVYENATMQGPGRPLASNPPHRTISEPISTREPPELRRARSPNAVEFPQSSRLKPLDLANPFHVAAREPRRRATLPSLIMDPNEAAALAKAIQVRSEDYNPDEGQNISRTLPDDEIGLALSTPSRKSNRRSRSADDLRRLAQNLEPARERTDQIAFWRQSTAGSVLRFPRGEFESEEDGQDQAIDAASDEKARDGPDRRNNSKDDPLLKHRPAASREDTKEPDIRDSPLMSRPGTAAAASNKNDIEARVSKLENGFATFQNALERLSANTNRRTIVVNNPISPRHSRQNTASMLVSDLHEPAETQTSPSYSPVIENPHFESSSRDESTLHPYHPGRYARPYSDGSYSTLYSIISQERNARRDLEREVRTLQQSLTDLQYQLSRPLIRRPTPSYSQRSANPTSSAPQNSYRESGDPTDDDGAGQRLTNRFSLSDTLADPEAAKLRDARDNASNADARIFSTPHQQPA